MIPFTHKNLEVWKKSIKFSTELYRVTKQFPQEELYGITSQMRRAAISIPSNISEGYGRRSEKEKYRFLTIALGSTSEIETQLILCSELGFIDNEVYNKLNNSLLEIIRMLSSLANTVYDKL